MSYRVSEVQPGLWFVDLRVGEEEEFVGAYIAASGDEAACIEIGPASTANKMLEAVRDVGIGREQVKYLLPTHIHLDHAGAAGTLIKEFTNAKVLVHPRAVPHIIDPEAALWKASQSTLGSTAEVFGKPEPVPEEKIISFEEGMALQLGDLTFHIIYTPGHSIHHTSIMLEPAGTLFPGDSAGCFMPSLDVVFPATPAPFRLESALESIDKLIALEPNTVAYTHFGTSPAAIPYLERERAQLLLWSEIFDEVVEMGIDDDGDILSFVSEKDDNIKTLLAKSTANSAVMREVIVAFSGFLEIAEARRTQ